MKKHEKQNDLVPADFIVESILIIRGQKVMLDSDLAMLYEVEVKRLNEAVKRNIIRFPDDFAFQLTKEEFANLKSQIATSSFSIHGGRRKLPYVFTEFGVAMLSSVLNSKRAILVNIEIIRTFIKLRNILLEYKDLKKRLEDLESKHDENYREIFRVIKQLMSPQPEHNKGSFGFETK